VHAHAAEELHEVDVRDPAVVVQVQVLEMLLVSLLWSE